MSMLFKAGSTPGRMPASPFNRRGQQPDFAPVVIAKCKLSRCVVQSVLESSSLIYTRRCCLTVVLMSCERGK